MCLDVVYNHLGPSGNRLPDFGPYFTDQHQTPWGQAVNLDGPRSDEVRRFVVDNAVGWLRDFHVDALRLDAVHALHDDRALPLLEQLSARVDALSAELGRPLWLVAESNRNDPRTVMPRRESGLGLHAQWADDVHHGLHVLLTGETAGYYADFAAPDALTTVLTGGFLHGGTWSTFRGRTHGRPVDRSRTPGWRFVVALQTHDQVGNRATGSRPRSTPARWRAGRRCCSPARARRCCSWARSGARRRPGSTLPTTRTPTSPRPCDKAGASSPTTAGPPRTCRTRRTGPP